MSDHWRDALLDLNVDPSRVQDTLLDAGYAINELALIREAEDNRMAETGRLTDIVRRLSRCHLPWDFDNFDSALIFCRFCDARTSGADMAVTRETHWHRDTCPWRLARELFA